MKHVEFDRGKAGYRLSLNCDGSNYGWPQLYHAIVGEIPSGHEANDKQLFCDTLMCMLLDAEHTPEEDIAYNKGVVAQAVKDMHAIKGMRESIFSLISAGDFSGCRHNCVYAGGCEAEFEDADCQLCADMRKMGVGV